jgi:extracellular factor (EF) 3-hydroxypalmitic acid methyl ester biosynthesis protein
MSAAVFVLASKSETILALNTMYTQPQIDPMVAFLNGQGEQVRGTIVNLHRKSLVMEVYNPYSIGQVSEVLSELTIRFRDRKAYFGHAVVRNIVNTGLTAVISVSLTDEWRELSEVAVVRGSVGAEAKAFVRDWTERFRIRRDYQIVINEMRAFLSDVSRWVEQVDLSNGLPKENERLREDVFFELATPLMERTKYYLEQLEVEASQVDEEQAAAHHSFAQVALHPLLLRAPFVYRAFTKPLGYAGDYQMVNQILDDPRQGSSTYFQIMNTAFLQTPVAAAHRNRIHLLVDFLIRMADMARLAGRPFRILNVGCGPAAEIQRFLKEYPDPQFLSFELVDFSAETLAWTRERLMSIMADTGKTVAINYVQDSVHQLLKRRIDPRRTDAREFDAVYCAGLFDYLSDKICSRLLAHFAARTCAGGTLLVTNVHSNNPGRFGMEHLLEWYLIYRDEARLISLLPACSTEPKLYVDDTGVNVLAEITIT